jgi:hypothetical protein
MVIQRFPKESLGRRNATGATQVELHRVPSAIHSAIQIHQLATNLNERLVGSPTASHPPLEAAPTLFAYFRVPKTHRRIVE